MVKFRKIAKSFFERFRNKKIGKKWNR